MSISYVPTVLPLQKREVVVNYLLTHNNPFYRTQVSIMRALGMSQATLIRLLSEMKGEGLVVERPFGTAVVYEIPYDVAVARGLAEKSQIFDLENYLTAHNQPNNHDWTAKVFNFGDVAYIYARHRSGSTIGIPVYDKDWKALIQGVALGLNIEALFTAIVNHFRG